MTKLFYKHPKYKGLKVPLFAFTAMLGIITIVIIVAIEFEELFKVLPAVGISGFAMLLFLFCFIYKPLIYSKEVEIFDKHLTIEGIKYKWEDVIKVQQLLNKHFFLISYKNKSGEVDTVVLNNRFETKELLLLNDDSLLVKKIKSFHAHNR